MLSILLLGAALAVAQTGDLSPPEESPRAASIMFAPPTSSEPDEPRAEPMGLFTAAPAEEAGPGPELPNSLPYLSSLFAPAPAPPPAPAKPEEKRRAMPDPWPDAPWPNSQYQGYPIIGVPPDFTMWPLMQLMQGSGPNTWLVDNKIRIYGWVTAEYNWTNCKNTNTPDSYWIRPNQLDMDQALLRAERNVDSVQTDHIDWGFRSTVFYGIDYRYTTAGGWFSDQLLAHNNLYGWDPTEQYIDVYVPWIAQGMIVRVGRWIACPDIETQFAPDNYMGSHSLLFTFDTYTQTGVMWTFKLSDHWTVQAVIHSGTDMAPWYKGAIATGAFGVRWVAKDNSDAFYGWLNAINEANFRHFDEDGTPSGHDNFNYWVMTWEHRFNPRLVTKTESYYMWQNNAFVGGTPSLGPLESFGSGGGLGAPINGTARTYGVLNYTLIQVGKRDFITVRNECWRDEEGERSGFPSTYTSNAIGLTHNFNRWLQVRPEIGYYRSWEVPAFDLGTKKNMYMIASDFTVRF